MHKSIEQFRKYLLMTWSYRNSITWTDAKPSPEKAFVLAVFSKIAYLKIPENELRHHSLVKIVPCLTYQQIVTKHLNVNLTELLRQADLGETFAVTSEGIVAVGLVHHDVIIISLRGTRPLHVVDWITDLQAAKIRVNTPSGSFKLHRGFLASVVDFVELLSQEVQRRTQNFQSPPPIYLTGHSLGGALAAIVGALDGNRFFSRLRGGSNINFTIPVHSTYTFGMPRYCDRLEPTTNLSPVHTFQPNDIVPSLPPTWLSYANSPHEYMASHGHWDRMTKRPPLGLVSWGARLWGFRGVRSHFIESYIKTLKTVVQ